MSLTLPNGATVFIASGYGSAIPVTALTNAAPPVATATAHGLSAGDIFEITSGWSRFNNKIARASGVTTNNFSYENLDSTLTSIYGAGNGVGSVRKITGWTQLQQIVNSTSSGGVQQFLTYQLLEADAQRQIPTIKNPFDMTFEVADDPTLAGYLLASAANDDRLPRAVKIALANGSFLYHNCYISLNRIPSMTVNQLMTCQVTMNMLNEPVRYSS
jgi:hypothetical protein